MGRRTVGDVSTFTIPFAGRGAWQTSTAYALGDVVDNDGSSYACDVAHTSAAGTEPGTGASWETVWQLLAEKGDQGDAGPQGEPGEAGAGSALTFVRAGAYDSSPQTCTGTYAQITGASAQCPTLGAGDMIRVDAVAEIVANGDTQDVDLRLQIGGVTLHERTAQFTVGVYLLSGWVVVDSLGASGEVTGRTGADETLDTTLDTTGPPSATVEVKSTGSPPTSTVRVRSITLRHYDAG